MTKFEAAYLDFPGFALTSLSWALTCRKSGLPLELKALTIAPGAKGLLRRARKG